MITTKMKIGLTAEQLDCNLREAAKIINAAQPTIAEVFNSLAVASNGLAAAMEQLKSSVPPPPSQP